MSNCCGWPAFPSARRISAAISPLPKWPIALPCSKHSTIPCRISNWPPCFAAPCFALPIRIWPRCDYLPIRKNTTTPVFMMLSQVIRRTAPNQHCVKKLPKLWTHSNPGGDNLAEFRCRNCSGGFMKRHLCWHLCQHYPMVGSVGLTS